MNHEELIERLQDNYRVLSELYRSANFEEEIEVALEPTEKNKFFNVLFKIVEPQLVVTRKDEEIPKIRGRRRTKHDLEWAARNLEACVHALFAAYLEPLRKESFFPALSDILLKELALLHLQASILCYEVEDYFLSVSTSKSSKFIKTSKRISGDLDGFFAERYETLDFSEDEKAETVKNLLITALLGANECYRKQKHAIGLEITNRVDLLIAEKYLALTGDTESGLGLKGLLHYIAGKIESYLSEFNKAEEHFRFSVELYGESLWRKERIYEQNRQFVTEKIIKLQKRRLPDAKIIENERGKLENLRREYELTRQVTLRRCALAQSFGHGFQSLVLGHIRDAIRSTSLARAVVHRNAGEIYSAYVDLIYFSAKRAERSSDYETLLKVKDGIERCLKIFKDLIPSAHYQNRAVFQLALVYHYLAKWWQKESSNAHEKSDDLVFKSRFQSDCHNEAKKYWELAIGILDDSIQELEKTKTNVKLQAESLSVLAQIQCNLALLEPERGGRGMSLLNEASVTAERAWHASKNILSVKLEAGLAKAAVSQFLARYLLTAQNSFDERGNLFVKIDPPATGNIISQAVDEAKEHLHAVLRENSQKGNNARIEATVYLRLVELALLYRSTWHSARLYFKKFFEVKNKVEHDALHQWSAKIAEELKYLKDDFVLSIEMIENRGHEEFKVFNENLESHFAMLAVNQVALEIEEEAKAGNPGKKPVLQARLEAMLFHGFGVAEGSTKDWVDYYQMIDSLKRICPLARRIPEKGSTKRAIRKD